MSDIVPCLWFAGDAEEAVDFYVSLLPNSRVEHVQRNVTDGPGGKEGAVLVMRFALGGRPFMALNGGTPMPPSHAVSFSVECAGQAELDRLWDRLAEGGEPVQCGWIKDRWGFSWQIVPAILPALLADPDRARAQRAMQAMLGMVKLDVAALEAAANGGAGFSPAG